MIADSLRLDIKTVKTYLKDAGAAKKTGMQQLIEWGGLDTTMWTKKLRRSRERRSVQMRLSPECSSRRLVTHSKRAVIINSQQSCIRVPKDQMQKYYKKHKVKKKQVSQIKKLPVNSLVDYEVMEQKIAHELWKAERVYSTVIWIDEVQFSSSAIQTHEWNLIHINYQLHNADLATKVVKLILGVSKQRGIEAFHFVEDRLNSLAFITFLKKIQLTHGPRLVCFLDNASWHRSNEVCKEMTRLHYNKSST